MPPTRRTSGPAAKGSQRTLSFTNTKVSKPSSGPLGKPSPLSKSITKIEPASLSDNDTKIKIKHEDVKIKIKHEDTDTETDVLAQIEASEAVVQQPWVKVKVEVKTEQEKECETLAEKVSETQIRKFWREREGERRTKRVHQEGVGVEEKILRLFDISSQFGPCIGIARMKRWTRAHKLGLNPPIEVLAVLLKEEKKGNEKIERAYVDELMSSKFIIGEA